MILKEIKTNLNMQTRPEIAVHSNFGHLPVTKPDIYLFEKLERDHKTVIKIKDVEIGGGEVVLMAGPCSLENERQMLASAKIAQAAGAKILRGGAFKPRTSPYSFQGNGELALKMQRKIADELNMLVVSEATGEKNLQIVAEFADIIQIGARNSQNFELLVAAASMGKPILYKRGAAMTMNEWLHGAEYLLAGGCNDVMLCERGTFLNNGEYTMDTNGIEHLKERTHLPIIADPTHASKFASEVPELAIRGLLAGADGLIIECHPDPNKALSDGHRALRLEDMINLSTRIENLYKSKDRYNSI